MASTARWYGDRNWPFPLPKLPNWRTNRPCGVNTWTRALPLSDTYTLPSGPVVIFAWTAVGALGSPGMNLNSPGPEPGLPHRRRTVPAGEITVTRWLRSVTYRSPSGPIVNEAGWFSPSDFGV